MYVAFVTGVCDPCYSYPQLKKKWLEKKNATQHLFYKISGFLFALNKHKKDDHFVIRQNVEIKAVLML